MRGPIFGLFCEILEYCEIPFTNFVFLYLSAFLSGFVLLPSILRGLMGGVIGVLVGKGFVALRDRPVLALNTNDVSNEDLAARLDLPKAFPEYRLCLDSQVIYECFNDPDCDFWVDIHMEHRTPKVG